jgi:hypothetical protein
MVKIPTREEFEAFGGAHCHQLWQQVGAAWICPSCGRSKFQILRWTKRFPNRPNHFMDWMATLHKHHDHSTGIMSRVGARFVETVICGQCNASDGTAKRKLNLPSNFSFAPDEIAYFVSARPHQAHVIDYHKAEEIWVSLS